MALSKDNDSESSDGNAYQDNESSNVHRYVECVDGSVAIPLYRPDIEPIELDV